MENIRQAVERAKGHVGEMEPQVHASAKLRTQHPQFGFGASPDAEFGGEGIELGRAHLESMRIVAHDKSDQRSRSYDMLRTQVLQSMDLKAWKVLGITSPSPSCGKTLTAVNLAFSIARQPERTVLLVDMDLRKPQVAKCLGLNCPEGLLSLLHNGQSTVAGAVKRVHFGNLGFSVLPTEAPTSGSSEFMASRAMSDILQDIRTSFRSAVVILDLPPTLSSDDVIAVLPQIDCALLVASVGTSTVSEIKQSIRHLQSTEVIRLVLNKAQEPSAKYYYYG